MRTAIVCVAIAALVSGSAADPPASGSVENWLRIGLERYERGNFVGAIEAFERGYAIEPRPEILFALAQAQRRRGACDDARARFEQFLAAQPSASQAAAARELMNQCEPAVPPPPPPVVEAPPVAAAPPPPPPPVTHRRDRVLWIAGGAAIASAATGATLLFVAHRNADVAASATRYDRHGELAARAERFERAGAIALGIATAAAAVVAWRLVRGDEHAPAPAVSLAPTLTAESATLSFAGRF